MATGVVGVSDNTASVMQRDLPPAHSELLCFVRQKCNITAADYLAKVCVDFYREKEIFAAKAMVEQVLSCGLPKKQGSNKNRTTVEDLIRLCLDHNVTLPLYYAVDLHRLPATDMSHCDVSAILSELQFLRTEVCAMSQLKDEMSAKGQIPIQYRLYRYKRYIADTLISTQLYGRQLFNCSSDCSMSSENVNKVSINL